MKNYTDILKNKINNTKSSLDSTKEVFGNAIDSHKKVIEILTCLKSELINADKKLNEEKDLNRK